MAAKTTCRTKKKNPRTDSDNPWKHAITFYFRDFMECCLPHIAEQIDWSKGHEFLDKELQTIAHDAQIGNHIADKLIKVWKKNGQETLVLCHLEIHDYPTRKFPARMMVFHYRIRDLYHKPIISIAILIDNNPRWRIDRFREECFGTSFEINYLVVKLLDYKNRQSELEAMKNPFATLMLAQLAVLETRKNPRARLQAKTALTRQLFEKGFKKQDIYQLYRLLDWLLALPKELMLEYKQQVEFIEGEKHMNYITSTERLQFESGFEEGFKKARQEAMNNITSTEQLQFQNGFEEGRQEGQADILLSLLQYRFHHIPANYVGMIQKADKNTIKLWSQRILNAKTLDEVFN